MSDTFYAIVREIANQYINSILFIDERAFLPDSLAVSKDKPTDLDVESITRAFTGANKICGFFAPTSLEDIEKCKQLVLKPDIVVLDWNIKIDQSFLQEDENQDDETDDRGYYTLELLKSIVTDAAEEKLKVVFIYTGEPGLNSIISEISDTLGEKFQQNSEKFEVYSDNVHIIVRLKPDSKVFHAGFDEFKVPYENLPDLLIDSFSEYVCGLIPCFAMKCITSIRENAAKILRVYNKGMDAELLAHEVSIPNPDDTKSYIAKSFGSAITDLIMEDESINTDLWADLWIDCFIPQKPSKKNIAGKIVSVSKESANKLFHNRKTKPNLSIRFKSAFGVSVEKEENNNVIDQLSRVFHQDDTIIEQSRYEFASLLHRKGLFSRKFSIPTLSLGSVVEKEVGGYYLCIQQRCDSVRIPKKGRAFLFLPLTDNKNSSVICALALAPGKCLYVPKQSYNLSIFTFAPGKNEDAIKATKENGGFFFISSDNISFKWITELNEINAQRIVREYIGQLSRVGLDEAEWLRIEGIDSL